MKNKHIYLIGSNTSMTGGTQRVTVNLANEFIKENNVTIINVDSDTGNKIFEINSNVKIRFLNADKLRITKVNTDCRYHPRTLPINCKPLLFLIYLHWYRLIFGFKVET